MANELSHLSPRPGERRPRTRVGRGEGAGKGKTAGRGTKGAQSRSGYKRRAGFEGGQMPLHRRLPKFGFKNPFSKDYAEINLDRLAGLEAGCVVTEQFLLEQGFVRKLGKDGVKVLGRGDVGVALHFRVSKMTRSAAEKVLAAGGTIEAQAEESSSLSDALLSTTASRIDRGEHHLRDLGHGGPAQAGPVYVGDAGRLSAGYLHSRPWHQSASAG